MSLASMGNVSIVVLLFFLIFAILGVQLFSGRFYSCNDAAVRPTRECMMYHVCHCDATMHMHRSSQLQAEGWAARQGCCHPC